MLQINLFFCWFVHLFACIHNASKSVAIPVRMLDNEIKAMKGEANRLTFEHNNVKDRIKENNEKIKLNKQLPYLVGNVVEVRA